MNSDVPTWCLNPKDFDEATHKDNPLRGMWIESMDKEIMGKMKNGPLGFASPVLLSEATKNGRRAMKVKWVYTNKKNIDGTVKELKHASLERVLFRSRTSTMTRHLLVPFALPQYAASLLW